MENQKQYVTPYDFKGKLPLKQAIPLGSPARAGDVCRQSDAAARHHECVRCNRRCAVVHGDSGFSAAERDAGCRYCDAGSAVLDWADRRTGSDYHGHQLRI